MGCFFLGVKTQKIACNKKMKIDLLTKLVENFRSQIEGKVLEKIQVCKSHLFRLVIKDDERFFTINLMKPFMNVSARPQDDTLMMYPFEDLASLRFKPATIQACFFDPILNCLCIELDRARLIFPFIHQGMPSIEPPAVSYVKSLPILELTQDEKVFHKRILENEKAFALKELFQFQSQKNRKIHIFEQRLINLPKLIEFENQKLVFILENQPAIMSCDPNIAKSISLYNLDIHKPIGRMIQEAYIKIRKLEREKSVLPKLIEIYKKKEFTRKKNTSTKEETSQKKQCRVFKTSEQEIIKVARSDKHADQLTFREAHGLYHWYHADGFPGAHVVIFSKSPSLEARKKAAFLAKYFSKAKQETVCDVIETQIKNLKKGKKPGEVMVSIKKVVPVRHDQDLFNQLFSPLLP